MEWVEEFNRVPFVMHVTWGISYFDFQSDPFVLCNTNHKVIQDWSGIPRFWSDDEYWNPKVHYLRETTLQGAGYSDIFEIRERLDGLNSPKGFGVWTLFCPIFVKILSKSVCMIAMRIGRFRFEFEWNLFKVRWTKPNSLLMWEREARL